jgi:hypothetical protein
VKIAKPKVAKFLGVGAQSLDDHAILFLINFASQTLEFLNKLMSVFYTIDPTLNLLYYAALGDCTGAQFIQAARLSTQDPLRQPGMLIIFDNLSLTDLYFDANTLLQGMVYINEWRAQGYPAEKTAILSKSKFTSDLLANFELMTERFADNWHVFPQLLPAIHWLGLDVSAPQILKIQAAFTLSGLSAP